MVFYKNFIEIISRKLKERDTLPKIIEKIKEMSKEGPIAFYPFGRLTRAIINEIKKDAPELLPRILCCFDKSEEVSEEEGVKSYHISKMDTLKDKISLLVIASNTFYAHQLKEIESLTNYKGKILKTSYFDISLPSDLSDDEILSKIKEVYNLLSDQKSKATYMVAWLSRMLNDEELTYFFESEERINIQDEPINYRGYKIKGIDDTCKKELFAELYKTKHVSPGEGDIVFDIGAYKGDTAIFFASHVGNKGKVYAFEPIKPNFDCLVNNIKSNKIQNVVISVNKGVSNKPGVLKAVSIDSGAPWSYLSYEKGDEVEVTTIDEFIESNKINKLDLIKIDVEGLEEDAILGAKRAIETFKPKLAIAIYHKTSDLIIIPLLVNKLLKYKFYIRSKIEGPFGFTFYGRYK